MYMRRCVPDPPAPPPPPPTPCELQRLAQLKAKKSKLKKCLPLCKLPEPPPKPCRETVCLCIERVKHPYYVSPCELAQPKVCVVERVLPGRPRCVNFKDREDNTPSLPCRREPPPQSAPPRPLTTCEHQQKMREAYEARQIMFMKKCSDVQVETESAAPEQTKIPEPSANLDSPKKKCKPKKSAPELPFCDEASGTPPPPPPIVEVETPPPKKKRSCNLSCLCLEKVKNPPLSSNKQERRAAEDPRINCAVKRQLPEKLRLEIAKDSDDDFINTRKLTIQSTLNPQDIANDAHDIDKEITELENLIKRLQAEIVEMTESASKPLQEYYPDELNEGNAYIITQGEENMSPIQKNEKNDPKSDFKIRKREPDVIFPVLLKDNSLLEEQKKVVAEKISNSVDSTNNADSNKDAIDDVRRNFSVLWDDAPNSNDATATIPKPTISESQPKPLIDQALEQSIPESDLKFVSNIPKPPDKTATIIARVELTDNVTKENDSTSLQGENAVQTIESNNDNTPKTVIGNISEIANERGTPDIPVKLNNESVIQSEAVKNSPGADNLTTDSKHRKPSRPASVESRKSIRKPTKKSSVVTSSSSNTNKSEKVISTILPNETSNTNQPVSKSESSDSGVVKTVNKKLSKIVGKVSSKISINNDKNESRNASSSTSDRDMSNKIRRSVSRIKSKDSLAQDDKGTNKNVNVTNSTTSTSKGIATNESQNTINKGNRKPVRRTKSRSSLSQSSLNKANSKNSSAERIKPVRSKSVTIKPLDSTQDANITKTVSNIIQNKHPTKDDVTNTVNTKTINTTDGPQVVETENIFTKSEIQSTQLPVAVAQDTSSPSVISKAYTDLDRSDEDSKTDTQNELTELEAAKEVNTVIVTEDFGTEVVEDELEGEEDLTDEGDLGNDNDNEPVPDDEDEEMMDCADEEDNTYDVD
uniref:Uncharacterized protein n=1 Tax=Heliothis virescens TaxID=7102 RepID=A0A2A4JFR6_HELVI